MNSPLPLQAELAKPSAPIGGAGGISKASKRYILGFLLVGCDVLAILLAIGVASVLRHSTWQGAFIQLAALAPLVIPLYVLVATNRHAFDLQTALGTRPWRGARMAWISVAISLALVLGVAFYLKASTDLSRTVVGLALVFSLFTLAFARFLYNRISAALLSETIFHEVVIVDGMTITAESDATLIDARARGWIPSLDDPVLLHEIGCAVEGADRVVLACSADRRMAWVRVLGGAGVDVEVVAPEFDQIGALGINSYGGCTTALVSVGPLRTSDRLLKRSFDIALVLLAMPVVLPVMLVVAVMIRLDSRGPIFFLQTRVGQGNRHFRMIKFRSMRVDATDRNGDRSARRQDSRVTRVGAIIRRLSLDELPQIFNVLIGDMSIVGPRPHAIGSTAEEALFWEIESRYWDRHAAKPGMTGLAQVLGFRGATERRADLTDRLNADLAYLQSWSVGRDIDIIIRTLGVLRHHRAF